jgi:hypothetical protein
MRGPGFGGPGFARPGFAGPGFAPRPGFRQGSGFSSRGFARPGFGRGSGFGSPGFGRPGFGRGSFIGDHRFFIGNGGFGRHHRFHRSFFFGCPFNNCFGFGFNRFGFGFPFGGFGLPFNSFGFGAPFGGFGYPLPSWYYDYPFGLAYQSYDSLYGRQYEAQPSAQTSGSDYSDYSNQISDLSQRLDRLNENVERLREENLRASREGTGTPNEREIPAPQATTVLVFRDNHTEQIKNYAIVGNVLWSFDERTAKKIPLANLDLAATSKLNSERGVPFYLPNDRAGAVRK